MNFNDDIDYIDTHCHLDLYKDYKTLILDSNKNKTFIVAVTNIPSVFDHECMLFQKNSKIAVALGFHPQLVESHGDQIELFVSLLSKSQFIGEVGLDYQENKQWMKAKQKKVFERVLNEAAKYQDKIISVHSRNSTDDVVSIIGKDYPGNIILHWYSGSIKTLEKAINNGYYFSVNPSMTKSLKGRVIIKSIPLERLLTETDGPFLEVDRKIVNPPDVEIVINYLSSVHKKPLEEIKGIVKTNFLKITESRVLAKKNDKYN